MSMKVVSFKLVYKEPPSSIILEQAENHSLHSYLLSYIILFFAQRWSLTCVSRKEENARQREKKVGKGSAISVTRP